MKFLRTIMVIIAFLLVIASIYVTETIPVYPFKVSAIMNLIAIVFLGLVLSISLQSGCIGTGRQ